MARIFSHIFRFVDDLCIFGNDEFESNYNHIDSDELERHEENEDPCKASFLDLSIEVHDGKFTTNVFHRRNLIPFCINLMPYLDSNIPSKTFYALVRSETLHVARSATDLTNMVTRVNLLLIWMKKLGSSFICIISLLKKIFGKHFIVLHRFADTSNESVELFSL